MATSTHSIATQRYSLAALWHLLSLDAPTVAVLWFLLAAQAAHLPLHAEDAAALALGTWMLYAIDRMLDARLSAVHLQEERHTFHGIHRNAFLAALACAVPVLIVLLARMEPRLLHAYLLLGLALTGYFTLIHTRASAHRIPKEFAVGIIFPAAIFMPEFLAGVTRTLLIQAVCFGTLCWLNCTLIYQREHTNLHDAHWSTRLAIRYTPLLLTVLAATGAILLFCGESFRALSCSILLSAMAMAALHRMRDRMARLPFRIAVDAALLAPLIFLPWMLLR